MTGRPPEPISPSAAWKIVGQRIFGDDWIGELATPDETVIQEYYLELEFLATERTVRVGSTKYCPRASRSPLDRAIGRYCRMNAQWVTAQQWLKLNLRTPARLGMYERGEIEDALAELQPAPMSTPGPGKPPDLVNSVERAMRAKVNDGEINLNNLAATKLTELGRLFGCSKNTAAKARKMVLANPSLRAISGK